MNNEEQHQTTALDEEGAATVVETNDATQFNQQEAKETTKGNKHWSEEKKVRFLDIVAGQEATRDTQTTAERDFWCKYVFPVLLKDDLTKDIPVNMSWSSAHTKRNTLVSTLTKVNRKLKEEIDANIGKDGAVYQDVSGNLYSGKCETEGREFVAKVYHDVTHGEKVKPPVFVASEYAKETCKYPLFEYFYSEFIVWKKPSAKVLDICQLEMIGNNRDADADEEASAKKAEASMKTANAEPRTADKDESRDKPKRVKREPQQKAPFKGKKAIENESFELQKKLIEAKVLVASEVTRQNNLAAEKNEHDKARTRQKSAQAVLESSFATDEQKKRALETLDGLF